jgi:mono/diheme cytochrome c family protein
VVYLDQGWSEADRQWFDHFSQGSAVLDYRLFLNLEAADSEQLFRSTLDDPRYGLILDAASPQNPDGLPIGITRSPVAKPIRGWPVGDYVGVTCAACHNGELIFKGRRVRIQGGNSRTVDLQGLVHGLDSALSATLQDPTKFKRLVARLGASTADAQASLKSMIEAEKFRVHSYATRTSATPHAWGPGRMDALSMILDRSTGTLTGVEQNWSPGIAPVKPPFLWNAPHGTWAQWAAVAQDPFNRNLTESIGVFLPVDLQSGTPAEGLFQSNASVIDLNRAEKQLQRLAPPSWPEDIFGKIDREKARAGKALFTELCAGCHNAWPYRWTEPNKFGKRFVIVGLIPQTEVGTDATQAKALNTFAITGDVAKYLPKQFQGSQVLSKDTFNNLLANLVRETALRKLNLSEAQEVDLAGYRELPPPPAPAGVYKAAPRDGVWATAPFLHNGSVPNLYEMLIPAAQRSKTFYLGSDFDPIKVGLDTSAKAGTFLMDTETPGNSNAGHSFQDGVRGAGVVGPLLTENQRWALIEYLKSIPEQPGRITPFGGPAQDQVPQK